MSDQISENQYKLIEGIHEKNQGTYILRIVNSIPYWISENKVITFLEMLKSIIGSYYVNPSSCFNALNLLKQDLSTFQNLEDYKNWIVISQVVEQYLKSLSSFNKEEDVYDEETVYDIISKNLNKVSGSNFQEVQLFLDDDCNAQYIILFFRLGNFILPLFTILDSMITEDNIIQISNFLKRNNFDKVIIVGEKSRKTKIPDNFLFFCLSEFVKIKKETVIKIKNTEA